MKALQALLAAMVVALYGYTLKVGAENGWNLFPVFFGDIAKMNWPGQFNADFMCLLILSGIWVAWRHQFSKGGILLGLLASVGGTGFLAPYLLVATVVSKGDPRVLLLGSAKNL